MHGGPTSAPRALSRMSQRSITLLRRILPAPPQAVTHVAPLSCSFRLDGAARARDDRFDSHSLPSRDGVAVVPDVVRAGGPAHPAAVCSEYSDLNVRTG